MARQRATAGTSKFTIQLPVLDDQALVDSSGNTPVKVNITSAGTAANIDEFRASIFLSDLTLVSGPTTLVQGPAGQYTASMAVVPPPLPATDPGNNNRIVTISALASGVLKDVGSTEFKVFAGSGSNTFPAAGLAVRSLGGEGRPVPIALRLQLDTPVAAGTCSDCNQLNRPTLLVYSHDLSFPRCWFSQPIDFCTESPNPGFWLLQKTDARMWTLYLRRGSVYVVTYRHLTASDDTISFPITMTLAGPGGPECRNWPRTVTITPAP